MGDTLLIIWLGAVGAAVGSFLNVVIYRLPRGESLVSPPSHCPKCNHRIRFYDNLPIFGWFFLGGKCRDCKLPISFRYPLIEIMGCIIVATFSARLMPVDLAFVRHDAFGPDLQNLPMTFNQVIVRIVWLSTLHLFLLAMGMIDFDRQTLKSAYMAMFLVPLMILGAFFAFLFPVPWFSIWPFEGLSAAFVPLRVPGFFALPVFDILIGALAALMIGFLTTKIIRVNDRRLWLFASFALGGFLGWQMAALILLVTLPCHAAIEFVTRRSCAVLALTAVAFVVNVHCLAH